MIDLNFKYKELLNYLKNISPFQPDLSIILGSGLGNFAKKVTIFSSVPTTDLPGYPPSTIKGHAGYLHFAEYENKKLLLFQGRIHLYEGYKIYESVLPVFISDSLEVKYLLLTNAAGGVNSEFIPGDLMLVNSINGINLKKELTQLIGLASEKGKNNFINFPSVFLNKKIKNAADSENILLREGIYWFTKGPSYETPAEIKMISKFEGDAVGMSTVQEAVFASYLGIETSVISVITNYASGISEKKLSHSDVTETAKLVEDKLENLLKNLIKNL